MDIVPEIQLIVANNHHNLAGPPTAHSGVSFRTEPIIALEQRLGPPITQPAYSAPAPTVSAIEVVAIAVTPTVAVAAETARSPPPLGHSDLGSLLDPDGDNARNDDAEWQYDRHSAYT